MRTLTLTIMRPSIMLLLMLLVGSCAAAVRADFDPVEAGERGLERSSTFPWYDRRQHEVRPVDVQPPRDSLRHRSSKWAGNWNWNWGQWRRGGTGKTILSGVGWFLLALVLAVLVVALGWALMRSEMVRGHGRARDETLASGREADAVQIENLPFPLEPTELDLLAEARRRFQAGEYEQSIIYLFSYQLVQLDHRQLLRLARGKTNRQYLRELRSRPSLRSILEQTMVCFEDVFFGGRNLTRAQFAQCWDQLKDFHHHVEQPAT